MANLQYIGPRVVPKPYRNPDTGNAEWKSGIEYEALTMVTYLSNGYVSAKPVPSSVGNPADNPDYWVESADFDAALSDLQTRVHDLEDQNGTESLDTTAQTLSGAVNELNTKLENCYLSALNLGLKNDGVTDNTALLNAIVQNDDYAGKNIFFPSGTYVFNDKVSVTKKIGLIGEVGTIFKATGSADYLLYINLADINYYERYFLVQGITFYCNDLGGVALDDFYDSIIRDCHFEEVGTVGLNTRYTPTSHGVQLHCDNVDFHNPENNTAVAIEDGSPDNAFNNIDVVNIKVGYRGNSVVNNFHVWAQTTAMVSEMIGAETYFGIFTNVYLDTVGTGFKINSTYNGTLIIKGLKVGNNTAVNTNEIKCLVIDNSLSYNPNIYITGLSFRTGLYKMTSDYEHSKNVQVNGVSFFTNPSDDNVPIIGGMLPSGLGAAVLIGRPNTLAALNREGLYAYSTSHPFTDLPTGADASEGCVIVKQINENRGILQILFSKRCDKIFVRRSWDGAGDWYVFNGTYVS